MTSEDIILAQSILDAANIKLPTGNPNDGVYDGKGLYENGSFLY